MDQLGLKWQLLLNKNRMVWGFPSSSVVNSLPANTGDMGSILVWEDPTCQGATKSMWHNYWACALEPGSRNYRAHTMQLLKPLHLEPVLRNKRSHGNEKPIHCNEEQPPLATTRESLHIATKTQHPDE